MRAASLLEFCRKVGLPDDVTVQAESIDNYNLSRELPAAQLLGAKEKDYEKLLDDFGQALNLSIDIPGLNLLSIAEGAPTPSIAQAVQDIQGLSPTAQLRFELQINKASILARDNLVDGQYFGLFFLFKPHLISLFRASLVRLDNELFTEPSRATVIVVSNSNIHYQSNLLTIVGESNLQQVMNAMQPPSPRTRERVGRFLTDNLESPSWVGFQLRNLTPLHFLGKWLATDDDMLDRLLEMHTLNLFILYTANRSNYNQTNQTFQATYTATDRSAALTFGSVAQVSTPPALLSRMVLWVYSGKGTDRLTIFQNAVAHDLDSDDPAVNYRSLMTRLQHVWGEARWHYRMYIDEKIDKHFEGVQKVVGYVTEVVKKLSDTIDTVTKSLADTLLATVGVLVVTVLAALIKYETSGIVFKISMRVYALYLGFFTFYRMGSIWHSVHLLQKDTDEQLTAYRLTLGRDKVDFLTPPVQRRRRQFGRWFWGTVFVYLLLAFFIWNAGTRVPKYLTDQGIIKPTPTPTQK